MNCFIITRFNLRLYKEDKNKQSVLNDKWLSERFQLFEDYCFASIKSQSYKDFIWIVLFDINTPDIYKNIINTYHKKLKQFTPFFLDYNETINQVEYIKEIIIKNKKDNDNQLITINLDNDDCLNENFIKDIIEHSKKIKENNTILTFTHGIQYFISENYAIRIPYINNHFIALLETYDEIKTVRSISHFYILKSKHEFNIEVIDSKDNPMWIENIHENNVDNDLKLSVKISIVKDNSILLKFGINKFINTKYTLILPNLFMKFIKQSWRRLKQKIRK